MPDWVSSNGSHFYPDARETYYKAYYYERCAEAVLSRWEFLDLFTVIVVALTATGSAAAGWALWTTVGGKAFWALVAGVASIASIVHGAARVPVHVKAQEELRKDFGKLRLGLEGFFLDLRFDSPVTELKGKFDTLLGEYKAVWDKAQPDVLATKRLRMTVQKELNEDFRKRGMLS